MKVIDRINGEAEFDAIRQLFELGMSEEEIRDVLVASLENSIKKIGEIYNKKP